MIMDDLDEVDFGGAGSAGVLGGVVVLDVWASYTHGGRRMM